MTGRWSADGALDRRLDVGDVDAVAGGGRAINGVGEVGLADDAEEAEIGDAGNGGHGLRFHAFSSRVLQVVAVRA